MATDVRDRDVPVLPGRNGSRVEGLELEEILSKLATVRVTVFGDFCLDAYWHFDTEEAEFSVETGLPIHRVREQRYTLGGAGSVVANLVELGVGTVRAVGAVGDDLFGWQLRELLRARNVDLVGFTTANGWQTMTYVKPMRGEREESRIDFGAFNARLADLQSCLIASLTEAVRNSDVVVLNQQVPGGLTDLPMIQALNTVIEANPGVVFVVDSRHLASSYSPAIFKLNMEEAARFLGETVQGHVYLPRASEFALRISRATRKPAFLTRGEYGLVVADAGSLQVVNGLRVAGRIDTVGAGDAVVATVAAVMGSGHTPFAAAQVANIAATVTVRKIQMTGTASPAEILAAAADLTAINESDPAEPHHAHKADPV